MARSNFRAADDSTGSARSDGAQKSAVIRSTRCLKGLSWSVITGLIEVLADEYSDDEPEAAEPGAAECNSCKRLQKENEDLHEMLRRAESKFLSLADALESTHSVIDPLQKRLLESQRLVRSASKLAKHLDPKQKEVQDAADTLAKLQQYPKEHSKALADILAPCNEAHQEFHAKYPMLADRIMIHGDGRPSDEFNAWFEADVSNYGRLFDEGNHQEDVTGQKVQGNVPRQETQEDQKEENEEPQEDEAAEGPEGKDKQKEESSQGP